MLEKLRLYQSNWLDYTNLFSLNDYKKNDKVIYKYFRTNMTSLNF